jgi:hypothetical protein
VHLFVWIINYRNFVSVNVCNKHTLCTIYTTCQVNKLWYVSTNTIKILPKLHKGQTELGKRVEVRHLYKRTNHRLFWERVCVSEKRTTAFNTAIQSMQTVIKFMKQTSSFHTRKVMQAQALQNILIKKRQACFKQADIWTLFKKTSEKTTMISKENHATLHHLYIWHCWPRSRRWCISWVALNTVLCVLLFAMFCKYDLFFYHRSSH